MTMAQFSRDDILVYQGREEGRAEGREEGRAEGREEGREEGIRAFILDKLEDGVEESVTVRKLQKRFSISEKAARQYYKTYAG